jgi:hypothetical protein
VDCENKPSFDQVVACGLGSAAGLDGATTGGAPEACEGWILLPGLRESGTAGIEEGEYDCEEAVVAIKTVITETNNESWRPYQLSVLGKSKNLFREASSKILRQNKIYRAIEYEF